MTSFKEYELFYFAGHNKWKERLRATILGYTSLGNKCQQVKKCMEIAMKCINKEKDRRPDIGNIVDQLNDIQNREKDKAPWREEVRPLLNAQL